MKRLLLLFLFSNIALHSQSPYLVKDLNITEDSNFSSRPHFFVQAGNFTYFQASDAVYGEELWRTDGTESGTTLVKDIYPGRRQSNMSEFVVMNDIIYFFAMDNIDGYELWRSDGTETGTYSITRTQASAVGNSKRFTVIGNTLYFVFDDGINGWQLWKTDGTTEGTLKITSEVTGFGFSLYNMTAIGDQILFSANDGIHGQEIWTTDGTPEGTQLWMDVAAGPDSSNPGSFVILDDILYFQQI